MSDLFLLGYHPGILFIFLIDPQAINMDEEKTEEYLQQSFFLLARNIELSAPPKSIHPWPKVQGPVV